MKQYKFIFLFTAMLALAAIACNGGAAPSSAPEDSPSNSDSNSVVAPTEESAPSSNDSQPTESGASSDLVTFTDENNLFSIDLPGDWNHTNSFNDEDGIYVDRFEAPDEKGFIENISGFSKTPLTGGSNGKVALYFIHKYYSTTGEQGDIRISDDSIQPDGSERLQWKSQSGGYSGISYFEVRGDDRKTFLMFTVWWNEDADQTILDTINQSIESYRIP